MKKCQNYFFVSTPTEEIVGGGEILDHREMGESQTVCEKNEGEEASEVGRRPEV